MRALFFNPDTGKWLEFLDPVAVFTAETPGETVAVLDRVVRMSAGEGLFAAGYITYEASPAFDPHFQVHPSAPGYPPARFALYREVKESATLPETPPGAYTLGPFNAEICRTSYMEKVKTVKNHLEKGDSYQINLTFRSEAAFSGEPFSWFREKALTKPGQYLAYIETPDFAFCSFSPELFFRKEGTNLTLKPMKGTAPPGSGDGRAACEALRSSGKNRAENLMIVDMIRNDAGRIAVPGSVAVPSLFDVEVYPTVLQMTSTVTAATESLIPEIFGALFPCASITGAPKIRSMEIIRALEESPRGLYTGTLGFITPDQDCLFNVAIRTAVIDKKKHTARYGTGSGVVWGSDAEGEWEECRTKMKVLEGGTPFYVFESMLLENGKFFLPEGHLARLEKACLFFGLPFRGGTGAPLGETLRGTAEKHGQGAWKVRVILDGSSAPKIECEALHALPSPYTLRLAETPVDPGDPFLFHKTNRRRHVDRALAEAGGATDVILVNTRGELTETTRANVVLELDGSLYTPPVSSGLLNGVYRAELIENGELQERILYPADLGRASKIVIINSVRRRIEGILI